MKQFVVIFIICQLSYQGLTQTSLPVDSLLKEIETARQICENDNGQLWGESLWGPVILIDPETREVVANQADSSGLLQPYQSGFVGKFPDDKIVSCGRTSFGGKEWAMISFDSPTIVQTIVHESFHRIQKSIEFNCEGYHNDHMDDMQSRISILLEWNALVQAVKTNNKERHNAIRDALLIRQARRMIYNDKEKDENIFEIHEGLALYTELKLCSKSKDEFKEKTIKRLENNSNQEASYMRSFGYFSGLLYAYLLDEEDEKWREGLSCKDDLGLRLRNILSIDLASDTAKWYEKVKKQYDYESIYNKELIREKKKQKANKAEIRMFCEEPVLEFDIFEAHVGINSSPHPLDTIGTVYPMIDVSDVWGFLSVTDKGCLLMSGKGCVTAKNIIIEKSSATGAGWQLNLSEGWIILKEEENYIIKKE